MKKIIPFTLILSLLTTGSLAIAAEKAPPEVIQYGETELVKWGVDPVIVKAVKEENAKNKTLDAIKALDEKWKSTPGIADFMKAIQDNECSVHLRKLREASEFLDEIFVMDNQGANVAMTDKTSDYWQGDEDKFTKSFNEGKGAIHIGDVAFDDSSQNYLVQISVPVKDVDPVTQKETVIGAITIGVNIDKFK